MQPYFERDGISIYLGDCREVLPTIETDSVDLVVTDPPYPNLRGGIVHALPGGVADRGTTETVGTPWDASLDWMADAWRISRLGMMVFCSYHSAPEVACAVPAESRVALLTWYKRNSPPAIANVPRFTGEFIWCFKKAPGLRWRNITNTVIDIPMLQSGCMAGERFLNEQGETEHPTQKPVALMRTLLAVGGDTILDPFMGTGTTIVAAHHMGRKAIGIEKSERWCDLAARRLQQAVLPLGDIA